MRSLDAAFSALSDPTGRDILSRLARGEATVMDLAQPFEISQPAISRHLRVLEEAGLFTRRVEGAKRRCRLAPDAINRIEPTDAKLTQTAFPPMEKNFVGIRVENRYTRVDGAVAASQLSRVWLPVALARFQMAQEDLTLGSGHGTSSYMQTGDIAA